jgi:hypothetical protein
MACSPGERQRVERTRITSELEQSVCQPGAAVLSEAKNTSRDARRDPRQRRRSTRWEHVGVRSDRPR